jgi:thiosulfate/3-mercaptopyruvate sulfurtransferase
MIVMTQALPLLLEAEQFATVLASHPMSGSLLILDTSSNENYLKHHLPGAIHIEPKALQCGTPPVPGKLPSQQQLTDMFSEAGLTADQQVVVYDDEGGGWAGRLLWTLDVLGHHNTAYLNGGIHAWLNEGYPVESGGGQTSPSDFVATIDNGPIAEAEQIIPLLGTDNFGIWDARSNAEYDGSKVFAKRGGHIPGAVNIDWLELIDRDNSTRLVDLEGLQQRLNSLGLTKDKHIITHCQTHHRSGLTYLAMKILGYSHIKAYHGSWSEWGNREDTPIEKSF